jgi:hypothetical protein
MEQFVWAAKNIHRIDPAACRRWMVENFSFDRIGPMYEEYFQSLLNLGKKGWYEENERRTELDWLRRSYPSVNEADDGGE